MGTTHRLAVLTLLAMIAGSAPAHAASITVAEFRWDLIATECPLNDPACTPETPSFLSVFSLTNLWDGIQTGPTLFNNVLSLPTEPLAFFDLRPDVPFNFDQLAVRGVPAFAGISTSFVFGTDITTLNAQLIQPNTFVMLQFDPTPVPEPGTFGLVALGAAMAACRRRHVAHRRARAS